MLSPLIVILVPIIVGSTILIVYHIKSDYSKNSAVALVPLAIGLYLLDTQVFEYEDLRVSLAIYLCVLALFIVNKAEG